VTRLTYHIALAAEFEATHSAGSYAPGAFREEGYIHCTDGLDHAIETANRYFRGDPRTFVLLAIDLDRVSAAVRYEDESGIYPHIYGRLERRAVVSVSSLVRDRDGTFQRAAGSYAGEPPP
jgi:uncharacterized protein (DUF952 family)